MAFLTSMGVQEIIERVVCVCVFRHQEKNVNIVVHVDDIFAVGE